MLIKCTPNSFSGWLTPTAYSHNNIGLYRFPNYADGNPLDRPRSQTKSSPTILQYFLKKLRQVFNPKKSRSSIQKRRLSLQSSRFPRPPKSYYTNRRYDTGFVNSIRVGHKKNLRRRLGCSGKFPYGHLKCCSVPGISYRRCKWKGK